MTKFIKAHDVNDGLTILLNPETISRIEERACGCVIYFTSVASDFDGTAHIVSAHVSEDVTYFEEKIV